MLENVDIAQLLMRELVRTAQKEPAKPIPPQPPTPPTPPAARFQSGQSPSSFLIYSQQGQLTQLGSFQNSDTYSKMIKTSMSNTLVQMNDLVATLPRDAPTPNHILATLLQLSIQFLKEGLRPNQEKRKRKHGQKQPKIDSKAEEQALELLDDFLDMAIETEDIPLFCDWADSRILALENELQKRLQSLPEPTAQMLNILRDAIMALRHGTDPEYIRSRLVDEINRKKKIQNDL